jgi:predicted HicB family RNase H-like nuclease
MALRKEQIDQPYYKESRNMKRTRITVDIDPELRKRIKLAASQADISISEYVENILEKAVPHEINILQPQGHPVTQEAIEQLRRLREQIFQENNGQFFEDSVELLRQQREELTRQIMGEAEE